MRVCFLLTKKNFKQNFLKVAQRNLIKSHIFCQLWLC